MPDTDWPIDFARKYGKEDTQTGKAFRRLADQILELRGENRVLRELVDDARPVDESGRRAS